MTNAIPRELKRVEPISLDKLRFDPLNPRFPNHINAGSEDRLIDRMVKEERVLELMESIGLQGYFPGEPLLVVGPPDADEYFVAEGNRRLAALKLLNGDIAIPERMITLQEARDAMVRPLDPEIPCIRFDTESEVLRYLGFRHITGVKPWKPLAKARYLKRLREELYPELEGADLLKVLAKEIGSRPGFVGQMLVGLTVLEKAESGDGEAWFGFPNLDIDKVDFTLLTTSLSYENIYSYVGILDRRDVDAENVDLGNLKNIIRWLYVKDEEGETIVGDSRNISMLAAVVGKPDSLLDLIQNKDLEAAFNLTSGPDEAFQLALAEAHRLLDQAYRLLARARNPNATHLDQAESNFEMSRTIRNVLRDKIEDAR